MKWPLYEQVALLKDVPEEGLLAGDVVTTVDFLESPKPGVPNGYFVEAFNAVGKTIAVFIVYEDDIEVLTSYDMLSRRTLGGSQNKPNDSSDQKISFGAGSHDKLIAGHLLTNADSPKETPEQSTPSVNPYSILLRDLPIDLLEQKSVTPEDVRLQLAMILFQNDIFSLGKASEFTGLHPAQFQQELANRQLSVHYDRGDYEQDVRTLETDRISQLAHHHDS